MANKSPTPIPPAAPTPVEPEPPEPKAWAFHYDGPIKPTDDRSCEMCNAASTKKCVKDSVRHGATPHACTTCFAARTGVCHHHYGIGQALLEHTAAMGHVIHTEHVPSWEDAKRFILARAAGLEKDGATKVRVRAHANQDQPDAPFSAVHIEIVAFK